jgi:hypothetical protein
VKLLILSTLFTQLKNALLVLEGKIASQELDCEQLDRLAKEGISRMTSSQDYRFRDSLVDLGVVVDIDEEFNACTLRDKMVYAALGEVYVKVMDNKERICEFEADPIELSKYFLQQILGDADGKGANIDTTRLVDFLLLQIRRLHVEIFQAQQDRDAGKTLTERQKYILSDDVQEFYRFLVNNAIFNDAIDVRYADKVVYTDQGRELTSEDILLTTDEKLFQRVFSHEDSCRRFSSVFRHHLSIFQSELRKTERKFEMIPMSDSMRVVLGSHAACNYQIYQFGGIFFKCVPIRFGGNEQASVFKVVPQRIDGRQPNDGDTISYKQLHDTVAETPDGSGSVIESVVFTSRGGCVEIELNTIKDGQKSKCVSKYSMYNHIYYDDKNCPNPQLRPLLAQLAEIAYDQIGGHLNFKSEAKPGKVVNVTLEGLQATRDDFDDVEHLLDSERDQIQQDREFIAQACKFPPSQKEWSHQQARGTSDILLPSLLDDPTFDVKVRPISNDEVDPKMPEVILHREITFDQPQPEQNDKVHDAPSQPGQNVESNSQTPGVGLDDEIPASPSQLKPKNESDSQTPGEKVNPSQPGANDEVSVAPLQQKQKNKSKSAQQENVTNVAISLSVGNRELVAENFDVPWYKMGLINFLLFLVRKIVSAFKQPYDIPEFKSGKLVGEQEDVVEEQGDVVGEQKESELVH